MCAYIGQTHVLLELKGLIHLAGKSIYEKAALSVSPTVAILGLENGMHRVLEKLDSDLHWYDLSLTDVGPDEVAELRVRAVLLCAQEIASRKVRKVVLRDKEAALCSLS